MRLTEQNFSLCQDEDRDEEKFPAAVRVSERMREDSLRAEEPDEAADFKNEQVDFVACDQGGQIFLRLH